MKLTGKKALITGGNNSIGLAAARFFVAEGAEALTVRSDGRVDSSASNCIALTCAMLGMLTNSSYRLRSRSSYRTIPIASRLVCGYGVPKLPRSASNPKQRSINTFDSPNAVAPRPTEVKVQNGKLSLTIEPRSVTVVSIEQ